MIYRIKQFLLDFSSLFWQQKLVAYLLVFANVIPVLGVFLAGWDAATLLILYWVENLVVGIYTILRMFVAEHFRAIPISIFFLIHYGFFCLGHGIFLIAMLEITTGDLASYASLQTDDFFILSIIAIIISHAVSLLINGLIRKEDQGRSAASIMHDPYGRMLLLHIAIIIGGFFTIVLDDVAILLLALIGLKISLDLYLHVREHVKRAQLKIIEHR